MNDNAMTDLAAGKAGEYLVCADLTIKGHIAFPSEQGLPYDVISDIGGKLYRVQVKTTRTTRAVPQRRALNSSYIFHISKCGKRGQGTYKANDVDLFALVALDSRTIGYISPNNIKRTMLFRADANKGTYYNEVIAARRQTVISDKESGLSNREIARKHGMNESVVSRNILNPEVRGIESPYLSSLTLESAICDIDENARLGMAA